MIEYNNPPFVSVIVPVYNDTERLSILLKRLSRQTYPVTRYEVIVVDNGSDEAIGNVPSSIPNLVIAREEVDGAYPARNKGVSISRGEIIAFTDSDCVPNLDWIEKGVQTLLQNPGCGMVAGRIDMTVNHRGQPTAVELYDCLTSLPQRQFVEKEHFGVTANLFIPRSVFNRLGPFSSIHKTEGGDAELGIRIHLASLDQVYSTKTVVRHPARDTFKALLKKGLRCTCGTRMSIEKYNLNMKTPLQYIWHHLWERPRSINYRMIHSTNSAGLPMRFKVIALYYIIKIMQSGERIRLLLGGDPRR